MLCNYVDIFIYNPSCLSHTGRVILNKCFDRRTSLMRCCCTFTTWFASSSPFYSLRSQPPQFLEAGFFIMSPVTGTQFNRKHFGLSFGLKKLLSSGLRFSTLRKCSKMCSLDMSQNQNGISIRFSSWNSSQFFFYWIGSLLLAGGRLWNRFV